MRAPTRPCSRNRNRQRDGDECGPLADQRQQPFQLHQSGGADARQRRCLHWSIVADPWPGTNIVSAQSVDFSGNTSKVVSLSFFYKVTNQLGVVLAGDGGGTTTGTASAKGDTVPAPGAFSESGRELFDHRHFQQDLPVQQLGGQRGRQHGPQQQSHPQFHHAIKSGVDSQFHEQFLPGRRWNLQRLVLHEQRGQ